MLQCNILTLVANPDVSTTNSGCLWLKQAAKYSGHAFVVGVCVYGESGG